jgi:NitT/TauT family transport system permease protein
MQIKLLDAFTFVRHLVRRWDVVALIVVIALLTFFAEASQGVLEPLNNLESTPLSLDPVHLPFYAARTTARMFTGLSFSLLFTLTYATWAAKSPRAEKLLIPILDILQSVPIIGFMSVTLVFFMSLAPGRVLGVEFASIFLVFTSQAWNMAFSFYQSLRTVPIELQEVAESFRLSPWMRFWRLEVPFGLPALLWNIMLSMAGGWFFVVAAEAIAVGTTTITLPGIGSYVALAIQQGNLKAIGWAILTMLIVIVACDQLIFRPLVAWADRFRIEQEAGTWMAEPWALTMMRRSRIVHAVSAAFNGIVRWTSAAVPRRTAEEGKPIPKVAQRAFSILSFIGLVILVALIVWEVLGGLVLSTTWNEILHVVGLALITMLRVTVLIAIASIIWVPIGIKIGLNPQVTRVVQPIAQFLAAFPANLLFPVAFFGIVYWSLNADIWLSPLMVLGTQWYILFNVIAGAAAMPTELRNAADSFGVRGLLWWRRVAIPAVFPYFVTGAITASGGSWNAAYVAEVINWKTTEIKAHGIGAYLAEATTAGDFHRILLGISVMCLFVVTINRIFWRPLYYYAERKFRIS